MIEASSNATASSPRSSGGARNSWAGRDPIAGRYGSRPTRTKLNFITPMLVTCAVAAAIAAARTERPSLAGAASDDDRTEHVGGYEPRFLKVYFETN